MIPVSYNVRSLAVRRGTTAAAAFGIGLVVFVLASAMMLVQGIKKTLVVTGQPDSVIVLPKGTINELSSTLDESVVATMSVQPQVKVVGGKPDVVGETVLVTQLQKNGTTGVGNVQLRGVPDQATAFRPKLKIVAGHAPQPGSAEAMVGKRLQGRFKGLDVGQTFELRKNRPVQVVGVFEDAGSSYESEVWVGLTQLREAFGRQGTLSSVRLHLDSPSSFEALKSGVEGQPRLGLQVLREKDYYEKQSEGLSVLVGGLGGAIAFFVSIGAMIGAMITMYSAVANRQREIGTLRALGFSKTSILFSFLLEAVALTLLGGILGSVASMAMTFASFSMLNMASWSEVVFRFEPTPKIILAALGSAVVMGVLGGFFPAVRAARISPLTAMRG